MKKDFLAMLRDPATGQSLLCQPGPDTADGEVIDGALVTASGGAYPIDRGVPDFVVLDDLSPEQRLTVDSFSWKWAKARNYRSATADHYQNWYLQRFGFKNSSTLSAFLGNKRRILDVGTGHGRDAKMYVENSGAVVVGMDISAGIHNAFADLGGHPRLHFVRADMMRPPFGPRSFDFVACDQALHHAPDTRGALRSLVGLLCDGGHLAFYVYRQKGPIREFTDDYLRATTTTMSAEECMETSRAITLLGKALAELNVTVNVPEDIPLLGIRAGAQDIQRFVYWNVMKCYWNPHLDFDSNVITNFDWYHPVHAHRHTVAEVRSWCNEEGLRVEHLDEQESGISVLAQKLDTSSSGQGDGRT